MLSSLMTSGIRGPALVAVLNWSRPARITLPAHQDLWPLQLGRVRVALPGPVIQLIPGGKIHFVDPLTKTFLSSF